MNEIVIALGVGAAIVVSFFGAALLIAWTIEVGVEGADNGWELAAFYGVWLILVSAFVYLVRMAK